MKYIILILTFVIALSCNKVKNNGVNSDELVLTILNDTIYSLDPDNFDYQNIANEKYISKGKNIIKFKIKNNSNHKIYFNFSCDYERRKKHNLITTLFGDILIVNSKDEEVDFGFQSGDIFETENFLYLRDNFFLDKMNYNEKYQPDFTIKKNSNFILYPDEIKYFETYTYLPLGDDFVRFKAPINKNEDFFLKIILFSEALDKKSNLTESELKNIEVNNYEVFDGELISTNKVPIKIIN